MREIKKIVAEHILRELENKDRFGDVLFLEGEPGRGKSTIIRDTSYEILQDVYNREIIDIQDAKIRVDIERAWLSIKDDIQKSAQALNTVEQEYGEDAKDILKEEISSLVISNAIHNFTELVKAVVFEEGDMSFDEYLELKKKKEELENQIILDPTEENIQEYMKISKKLKIAKVKRESPAVYYDMNLASANLAELNGMLLRVLGTITKLPPMPFVLLATFGGVLFTDELTNVTSEPKLSALYRLYLNKVIGDSSLINYDPKALGVAILAAGNNYESSKIANILPQALRDRLVRIRLPPLASDDITDIGMYFQKKYPHFSITGRFVSVFMSLEPKDVLNVPSSNEDIDNSTFSTPRSFERLLIAMANYNGDLPLSSRAREYAIKVGAIQPGRLLILDEETQDIVERLAEPRIGPRSAKKFATKWIINVPTPKELINEPDKFFELSDNLAAYMIAMNDYIRYLRGVFDPYIKGQARTLAANDEACKIIRPFVKGILVANRTHHAEIASMWLNIARAVDENLHLLMLRQTMICHKAGKIPRDEYIEFRDTIRHTNTL